jgi:hypothetical protein
MTTQSQAVIRLKPAMPQQCVLKWLPRVLHEIAECYNFLRRLRYAKSIICFQATM